MSRAEESKRTSPHSPEEKLALGSHLAAARKRAGYTQEAAAQELHLVKQTINSWEKGRNIPDALWLRRLARLYETSVDALVGYTAATPDAMKVAHQFDSLSPTEQAAFRSMWPGYVDQVKAISQQQSSGASLLPADVGFQQHTDNPPVLHEDTPGYSSPSQQQGPAKKRHEALEQFASLSGDGNVNSQDQRSARKKGGGGAR